MVKRYVGKTIIDGAMALFTIDLPEDASKYCFTVLQV
jgi:hypothetical protein